METYTRIIYDRPQNRMLIKINKNVTSTNLISMYRNSITIML